MEVVGGVVGDVGGQGADEEPWHLWATGERGGSAERTGEHAADVVLAVGDARQFVVAIAGHEVPLFAEVMIEARDAEIIALGNVHVAGERRDVPKTCLGDIASRKAIATGDV